MVRGMTSDLEAAWDAIFPVLPLNWTVGKPYYHEEEHRWGMYAYDTRERPKVGQRLRTRTAVAATELEVIREMARCLGEISAGRMPK
jgi:hypothetical protein